MRSGPGSPPRALRDVDTGGLDSSLDEPTDVAASSAEVLLLAFTDGDAALRSLDPGQVPTLWPEHFDIGITVAEVNYGVSPGDTLIDEPYALSALGRCRAGAFWNQSFGAARPLSVLTSPKDIQEFFLEGQKRRYGQRLTGRHRPRRPAGSDGRESPLMRDAMTANRGRGIDGRSDTCSRCSVRHRSGCPRQPARG
ncbi:MAG TPA: hypothetical protein VIC62_11670 [Nakamurella sp.]